MEAVPTGNRSRNIAQATDGRERPCREQATYNCNQQLVPVDMHVSGMGVVSADYRWSAIANDSHSRNPSAGGSCVTGVGLRAVVKSTGKAVMRLARCLPRGPVSQHAISTTSEGSNSQSLSVTSDEQPATDRCRLRTPTLHEY